MRNAIRRNRTATRTMTTTKSTVIVLLEVDLTPNELEVDLTPNEYKQKHLR